MIQAPESYVREANEALYEDLGHALGVDAEGGPPDWDRIEAISKSFVDLAQTFTRPNGVNR